MKHQHTANFGHVICAIGTVVILTIVGLWSWNTLGDLFGLPAAQYRHVIAAIGLLFVLRFSLFHSRHHWTRKHSRPVS
jgi:uncharacterized membrane protein YuzA (DUF378 family)